NTDVFSDLISKLDKYTGEADAYPNAKSINAVPSFKTTVAALRAFGLTLDAVKDRATVFVPTDEAYAEYGINSKNVSQFPMVMGAIANQVISNRSVKGIDLVGADLMNVLKVPLTVTEKAGQLYVSDVFGNEAKIIRTDFNALNSTTHFIDKVLFPPTPSE
ncbi:MAG: fasciclin domain-containing protein, partial [Bacteroidetes bacterium]|nr:fasciclin domain-containing protein [Bacteroidota bacterium]